MMRAETRIRRVLLFPANTSQGWRVIRMVTTQQGETQEAKGKWRRVTDANTGNLIGFQLLAPGMASEGIHIVRGQIG